MSLRYRKRVDGRFLGPGGSSVPNSQALCSAILEECFEIAQEIRAREDDVSFALKPIFDRLWETRAQLESLLMTHRWTLRETDLWNYSLSLQVRPCAVSRMTHDLLANAFSSAV